VVAGLRSASAILLFGPGEAKGELKNRLERDRLDLRINRVETSDKMTERQILEKVRRHYSLSNAENGSTAAHSRAGSFDPV
jgi:hypothetical protein